jgi:hypothetical protein
VLARRFMDVKDMARMGGHARWAKVRSKRKRSEIMRRVRLRGKQKPSLEREEHLR